MRRQLHQKPLQVLLALLLCFRLDAGRAWPTVFPVQGALLELPVLRIAAPPTLRRREEGLVCKARDGTISLTTVPSSVSQAPALQHKSRYAVQRQEEKLSKNLRWQPILSSFLQRMGLFAGACNLADLARLPG